MTEELLDKLAIRELLENWAVWRDAGYWERSAPVWHDDGFMMATWFQGTADEFISMSRAGFERGVNILHFLGGCSIDLAGNRAVSQMKMTISQRAPVHDVMVDVLVHRPVSRLPRKAQRQMGFGPAARVLQKDRMDPVDPAQTVKLDPAVLGRFPVGYRNLAHLQSGLGFNVKLDLPGLAGPANDKLYAFGKTWLEGGSIEDARK